MSIGEGIGILFGITMTIGLISVLFYGFRVQDHIKKANQEIKDRYVPELLQKPERKEDEETPQEEPPKSFWLKVWERGSYIRETRK